MHSFRKLIAFSLVFILIMVQSIPSYALSEGSLVSDINPSNMEKNISTSFWDAVVKESENVSDYTDFSILESLSDNSETSTLENSSDNPAVTILENASNHGEPSVLENTSVNTETSVSENSSVNTEAPASGNISEDIDAGTAESEQQPAYNNPIYADGYNLNDSYI